MKPIDHNPRRQGERGQTIILVALTVVTMLAMAALAIDVVTLYVARTEMQRAADGAALAAAKGFVDSGVTTDPTNSARQTLATDMATALINSTIQENKIGGVQPSLVGTPTPDFTRNGNPHITVTLQRTNLPMFFARIWGSRAMTVTASATAEAYNPSGTAGYAQITLKCVKPLLIPNKNPLPPPTSQIVDPSSGQILTNLIGKQLTIARGCAPGGPPTTPCFDATNPDPNPSTFLPATVTGLTLGLCPSCSGGTDYERAIECCDMKSPNTVSCGGGAPGTTVQVNTQVSRGQTTTDTRDGLQCLINKPSQDTIDPADLLTGIGPARITATSGPQSGNLVTASRSIATFPIVDTVPTSGQGTVVAFLQGFIEDAQSVGGFHLTVTVLNVIGCGNAAGGAPAVVGGTGTSVVPVRLIQ
jgi:Flp pilus assembly protein TadG